MVRSRNNSNSSNSSGSSTGSRGRSPTPEPRTRDAAVQTQSIQEQIYDRLQQLANQPNAFSSVTIQVQMQLLVQRLELEAGVPVVPILILSRESFADFIGGRLENLTREMRRRARLIRIDLSRED